MIGFRALLGSSRLFKSPALKTLGTALLLGVPLAGCEQEVDVALPPPVAKKPLDAKTIGDAELKSLVDQAIQTTADRTLDQKINNAWQVVHGILAYGRDLQLTVDGKRTSALEYLFEGKPLNGWTLFPTGPGRLGAELVPGSSAAQGHADQWIGYLSQCGVKLDDPLIVTVNGKPQTHKFRELIEQAKHDIGEVRVGDSPTQELTWTLMAFAEYSSDDFLPLDGSWKNRNGEEWTFERMMDMEAEAGIVGAACGGSHRLYAIAEALMKYRAKHPGKPLTGGWAKAEKLLNDSIRQAREYQQPDGGFSTNKFQRSGISGDVDARIDSTGHVFEVLAYALSDEELKSEWFTRAALFLTKTIDDTKAVPLNCGGLYHGAHGLIIYRDRRFGPPSKSPEKNPMSTAAGE
ncbi:MAG: hypothetical protein JNL96_11045 [Planctomycetaceae bacterium]|nr:hypothetical protein [Planctomycetaceae bacterium]